MTDEAVPAADLPPQSGTSRLWETLRFFSKLGVFGFGGPIAHIALMEDELVRRRRWVRHDYFVDALAVTNLIPGPNSTEMGIHLGYERAGLRGALVSGLAFVSPAFLLVLALSWAYFRYGSVPQMEWLFYGLRPAVITVILTTVWRTGRAAVTDWRLALLLAATLIVTLLLPNLEILALFICGLVGIVIYSPPQRWPLLGAALLLVSAPPFLTWHGDVLKDVGLLFLRTGSLLFGGGYVMIPLIEHDVVDRFGWLTRSQFLDGVALGQTTPGPIVITATFIGYAAAGLSGAIVATAAIFAPSFAFAILSARFLKALRGWQWARGFLKGIAAAVVGAILAAAISLARAAIIDPATAMILATSLAAAFLLRVDAFKLLGAGAAMGLVIKALTS